MWIMTRTRGRRADDKIKVKNDRNGVNKKDRWVEEDGWVEVVGAVVQGEKLRKVRSRSGKQGFLVLALVLALFSFILVVVLALVLSLSLSLYLPLFLSLSLLLSLSCP